MAASPGADALLSIGDMYSSPSPPSSPVLPPAHENSSLTTAAPPEPTQLYHTTPTPPPLPEQDMAEQSELGELPPPEDCGDLGPSLPPHEAAPSAPRALEAASLEKLTSPPSCPLGALVEVFPDVPDSAASPPPSPQFGEAPPGDAPPLLPPPPAPPVTNSPRAVLDSSTTNVVEMASREAASPTLASELDSHSAPAPLTSPLESGPEWLSLQQRLRPASPAMTPQVCENSEPTQSQPLPAESAHMLSDAVVDEVAAVASTEAAGSTPALDGERDTAPHLLALLDSGVEGELSQQQARSPHLVIVPPLCQNSEPAELPQLLPPSAESTYCSLEAVVNEVAAVALEEAAEPLPPLDAMGVEAALASQSEGPLQEPMQTSSSPKMEVEACSPDMAPPGFENFKSKWLPQPAYTMPVQSTHYLVEAPVTDTAGVMPEAAARSLPMLETMDVEMDLLAGQLPSSKNAETRPLSLTVEATPCSPDTPPPGFENFKASWLPQPTIPPSAETAYLPDVTTTKEELVEKSCSVLALDTVYMEIDTAQNLLPTLESGVPLLEVPQPSSPSHEMQPAPSLPDKTPPVFESLTLPQLQFRSPFVQTSHIAQDSASTGPVCLTSEDEPSPVLKSMDVEMDAVPALPPSSESGAQESMQQEHLQLPSCSGQGTCSLEILSSRSENLETLEDAVNTTVTVEAVSHPLSVPEGTEEAKGHILSPQLESGYDGPLPCLESKPSSPAVQAVTGSPEITTADFESLESSQQTSPCGAERIDSPSNLPFTNSVTFQSEKMTQPSPLPAADTDMESAQVLQSPLNSEQKSLPHPQHQPSSPPEKDAPCSLDNAPPGYENLEPSEELPPPRPLCTNLPFINSETFQSEKTTQPSPLPATDTDTESAQALQSPLKNEQKSLPHPQHQRSSPPEKDTSCSPDSAPPGYENLESSEELPPLPPLCTNLPFINSETFESEKTTQPSSLPATETDMESTQVLQSPLKSEQKSLPHPQHQPSSPPEKDAPCSPDSAPPGYENLESSEELPPPPPLCTNLPFINSETYESEKTTQPSPLPATDIDMESAHVLQSPLKSEQKSLPHSQHQPSSPPEKDAPCFPDSAPPGYENLEFSEELPSPPPLCTNFEMGQMVCGCCRELIAYPRGAVHVQCFGCWTINLVLEAHQVGKVYCGQCETLLMYPFGAPAVRCSNCLFVTEIGERNVRQRMSAEQGTLHHPQEVVQA